MVLLGEVLHQINKKGTKERANDCVKILNSTFRLNELRNQYIYVPHAYGTIRIDIESYPRLLQS